MSKQPGRTVDRKEVAKLITDKRKEKLAEAGMTVLRGAAPSARTVKNYVGIMALCSGMSSTIGRSNPKTPTRFTAEHSIRSAANFAATTAAAHFIPQSEPDPEINDAWRGQPTVKNLLQQPSATALVGLPWLQSELSLS